MGAAAMETSLLRAARFLLHVAVVAMLTLRSKQLGAALHPYQRALANDWVHLLFYVDTTITTQGEVVAETLPHFLMEIEEEIAANVDDEFFGGGLAARASALPVGALFTIDETRQHLHGALANYFRLADVALDSYLLFGNDTELPPPQLTVRADIGQETVDKRYNLTHTTTSAEWPAPLRLGAEAAPAPETREFFNQLDAMQLSFVIGMRHKEDKQPSVGKTQAQDQRVTHKTYEWRVVMRYNLQNQGHLEVTMNYDLTHMRLLWQENSGSDATSKKEEDGDEAIPPVVFDTSPAFDWVLLLVITLYQTVELTLKWMAIKSVTAARSDPLQPAGSRWSTLTTTFIAARDFWFWFILAVNAVTLTCLLATWRHAYRLSLNDSLCLAFASSCALHWGSLVRYLQVNARFHILGLTLRRGLPRVAQFLAGVLPIFVGFVLFGTVMFGAKVPRFQSASATATTLFSVANGDEIQDTFDDVAYTPWIGQIYVYVYMILFSYVVLMVCIGIIEDAFFSAVFPASWPTSEHEEKHAQSSVIPRARKAEAGGT